ncbi:MAG: VTT domain-containing protein [Propionibacteriaceae bacterium]|nr:VTT domain-containing protein [Propionibacteriaceae bacterium]
MLLPSWLNPENILNALGNWALWGVVAIVIVECGLFCFFLPGDSLLFAVGMFVALGTINFGELHSGYVLAIACLILSVAAILGNTIGYWLGRVVGPPLLRPRTGLVGKIFKQEYADSARVFFESRGHIALVLARFVPVVRTFVTLVAGISHMRFATFIGYSAVGGVLWGTGVTILGYFLGTISFIHNHIEAALVLIVLVSFIPVVVEMINQRRAAKSAQT